MKTKFDTAKRREFLVRAGLAGVGAGLLPAASLPAAQPESSTHADVLIRGTRVYTMDDAQPLAEAVALTAPLLADRIPHQIELYTGPFCPEDVADRLRELARGHSNIRVERFCPDLHQKLVSADLSISMGGYNTIMNVIATGVPAMIMGCTNNGGMDQVARAEKLADLGVVDVIRPEDLDPMIFAEKIIASLSKEPTTVSLDINGVTATMRALSHLTEGDNESETKDGGEKTCVA